MNLEEMIELLRTDLDRDMRKKFSRSLPLNELLTDRWKRAKELGFGEGSSVYDSCLIFGDVKVGKNTWIGPFTILDGTGGLEIGDNCSISAGVHIYSHDSVKWAIENKEYEYKKVVIGSNCYVGPHSIISKGVEIGEGSVIGASSFVNKSFGVKSKLAGRPASIISEIEPFFPMYGV